MDKNKAHKLRKRVIGSKIVCMYGHDPLEVNGHGERPIGGGDREWISKVLTHGTRLNDVESVGFETAEDGEILIIGMWSMYRKSEFYVKFKFKN